MFFIRSGDCKVDGCTTSFALAPQLSIVTSSPCFQNFLLLSKQVLNDAGGEICTMKKGQSFGEVGLVHLKPAGTLHANKWRFLFFSPCLCMPHSIMCDFRLLCTEIWPDVLQPSLELRIAVLMYFWSWISMLLSWSFPICRYCRDWFWFSCCFQNKLMSLNYVCVCCIHCLPAH